MADLATIVGVLTRNTSGSDAAEPWAGRTIRCQPVVLDESAAIVDSRSDVLAVTDESGQVLARDGGPLRLWPGTWRIMLPDGEVIVATVEAGVSYTLLDLRGFVAPHGVTVQTLLVPSGAVLGSLLAWGEDGLTWADGVSPEAVADAVADYLAAHPVEGVTEAELAAALADLAIPDSPEDVGADPAGTAASAVSGHIAAADPHPQYLTGAEGDARYDSLGSAAAEAVVRLAADTALGARLDAVEARPVPDVTAADLAAHSADTTAVHGIADTTALVVTTDLRLSDSRTPTTHTHPAAQISDATTVGRAVLTAADAAGARAAIGAGTSSLVLGTTAGTAKPGDWAPDLSGLVPVSLVDAKGDLLVGSAPDALIRLPVGSDGQTLTADAASTGGIKWAAASGGGDPTIGAMLVAPTRTYNVAVNHDGRTTDAPPPGKILLRVCNYGASVPVQAVGVPIGSSAATTTLLEIAAYTVAGVRVATFGTCDLSGSGMQWLAIGSPVHLPAVVVWAAKLRSSSTNGATVHSTRISNDYMIGNDMGWQWPNAGGWGQAFSNEPQTPYVNDAGTGAMPATITASPDFGSMPTFPALAMRMTVG